MVAPVAARATGAGLRTQVGVRAEGQHLRRAHRPTSPTTSSTPTGRASCTRSSAGTWINAERHTSRASAKRRSSWPEPYTPSSSPRSTRLRGRDRGAAPSRGTSEDVSVGEELPAKVKGPLTTTDVIVWHLGWGMQLTPPGAYGSWPTVRRKAPGLYPAERAERARHRAAAALGARARPANSACRSPTTTAGLRETWLAHLVTDWMGDDGWLWKLRASTAGSTTSATPRGCGAT